MTPEVGQMFGPYEILGRLGSGGMGLVFRAWDQRLHREVAIKIVRDNYRVPGMRERFLQEARAASRLSHPNICTVFDIGEQGDDPYLVMELLEGETLKERIARSALSAEEIVHLSREIADALAVAHAKRIIHRDIKPANILLVRGPNGATQAKVLDFGLAKINNRTPTLEAVQLPQQRGDETPLDLTVEGVTVGTVSYMSPEQARGHALDPRSDLFSLGVVMYEMATRRAPFRGSNSTQVFTQILEHDPEPVRNWNDSIPRDLERLILKLLSKDRRLRFSNAQELSAALEKLTGRMARGGWLRRSPSTPVVPIVPSPEPVAYNRRRIRRDSQARTRQGISGGSVSIQPVRAAAPAPAPVAATPQQSSAALMTASSSAGVTEPETTSSVSPAVLPVLHGTGMNQFEFGAEESSSAATSAEVPASVEEIGRPTRRWALPVTAIAAVAIIAGAVALLRGGHLSAPIMTPKDVLLLTTLQDRTDEQLGGAVLQGLAFSLGQTHAFGLRGNAAFLAGARQLAGNANGAVPSSRAVAQQVGAKVYLYGEIRHPRSAGTRSPYAIRIDALRSDTNDRLLSLSEQADTRAEIPSAIDRLSRALRSGLGEDRDAIAAYSEPLQRQATGDIDALRAYADGDAALGTGRELDAITAFRTATERDGQFSQAHLQLAWLYTAQHAEVAASEAARLAQLTAKSGNERLRILADYTYQVIAIGDLSRAASLIRQYNDRFPGDAEGMLGFAHVLRLQGHLVESLLAAQQTIENDPYRPRVYREAELDLIGQGRYQDAIRLEQQAETLGLPVGRAIATARLLSSLSDPNPATAPPQDSPTDGRSPTPAELADHAIALDNAGHWEEGEQVWTRAAAMAATIPGLQSSSGYLLSQAALNRAIAGRCNDALGLLRMNNATLRGPVALFRGGMTSALCGRSDEAEQAIAALERLRSNDLPVSHFGPFEIRAALALQHKDPATALHQLEQVDTPADYALLPYLRSLAYTGANKPQQAAEDLQSIIDHRGAVYLSGISLYPQAKLELDRSTIRTQLAQQP